jgi:hypothetical protein
VGIENYPSPSIAGQRKILTVVDWKSSDEAITELREKIPGLLLNG